MEATIVYWGYIGIMENKMETTIGRARHHGKEFAVARCKDSIRRYGGSTSPKMPWPVPQPTGKGMEKKM